MGEREARDSSFIVGLLENLLPLPLESRFGTLVRPLWKPHYKSRVHGAGNFCKAPFLCDLDNCVCSDRKKDNDDIIEDSESRRDKMRNKK